MMLQNMKRRSLVLVDALSRIAAICNGSQFRTRSLNRDDGKYLLCVDEIPMQHARLKARDSSRALGVGLHPAQPQHSECVGVVAVLHEVGASPLVQLDGVEVLDDGALAHQVIHHEQNGILVCRRVQLRLCTDLDGLL